MTNALRQLQGLRSRSKHADKETAIASQEDIRSKLPLRLRQLYAGALPLEGVEAREGVLYAIYTQHIRNLAEQAMPVTSNLGHIYTLARTRPP